MAKLVAYYSRADENYFGGQLRYIEVGNTEKAAKMIAEQTGADLFKIEQKTPYAKDYNTCIAQAKKDLQAKARPELVNLRKISTNTMKFILAIRTTGERCRWQFIHSWSTLIFQGKRFIHSAHMREAD